MATTKKSKTDSVKFSTETLGKMLLSDNYSFPDSHFEPCNDRSIAVKDENGKNQLTLEILKEYLNDNYGTGDRLSNYDDQIKKIIGSHRFNKYRALINLRAKEIRKLNQSKDLKNIEKSEYYKVLTLFTMLSKVEQGWCNLFLTSSETISKPSLSVLPSRSALKEKKKSNDAIIRCYYARLLQGMTKQDRDRYQILLPDEFFPSRFDKLLILLDDAIQNLFCYVQQNFCGYYDDRLLPDTGLNEALKKTRYLIHDFFKYQNKEDYSADTLRATLIKFASINFAINHIEANINIQSNDFEILPHDIRHLKNINNELEILPAISKLFTTEQKKLPNNIIECSKLVCKMYILEFEGAKEKAPDAYNGFSELHMQPFSIAVSAALLSQDFYRKKGLIINTIGETNKGCKVYKTLSDLSKRVSSVDALTTKTLSDQAFPQELFKYLTSRYAIAVRSFSSDYSAQEMASAHMKVRRKKFELQQETYELLKDMSIQEIHASICDFYNEVFDKINSVSYTYNKLVT